MKSVIGLSRYNEIWGEFAFQRKILLRDVSCHIRHARACLEFFLIFMHAGARSSPNWPENGPKKKKRPTQKSHYS